MKKGLLAFLATLVLVTTQSSYARPETYGESLCKNNPNVHCITVQKGQSWRSLWSSAEDRNKLQRFNRMNTRLHTGMRVAIPNDLSSTSIMELSPFSSHIDTGGRSTIIVDLHNLAWGAYDPQGSLVNWGPASGGKSYCPDVKRGCRSPIGSYTMYRKKGAGCFSSKYPVGKGGAPMPYCMFFHRGYAMHGSRSVPGYHASHGCVRTFKDDAQWLNQDFINVGGTRVIVKPYDGSRSGSNEMSL